MQNFSNYWSAMCANSKNIIVSAMLNPGISPLLWIPALAVIAFVQLTLNLMGKKLPPGPRGYPILGNIFDIPGPNEQKWEVFLRMSREIGSDIISLKIPGPPLIILNSASVADDLFVKRTAIYSDRMPMLYELVKAGWNLAIMPYGDAFKAARRVWHKHVTVPPCRPHVMMAVRRLLKELLVCSGEHEKLVRLTAARFILSSSYGISPQSDEDPFFTLTERWIQTISHATQRGGFLVDTFPILKYVPSWVPGAGFQKKAAVMRQLTEDVRTLPFNHTRDEVTKGTAVPSYASRFLGKATSDTSPEEIDAVCSIIGNMYLAGADTSYLTLCTFLLAMALHPEIQKKGQQAVDEALGGDRMPTFADFGRIPYVEAIINEVLRWKPAVTITIPHGALQDDIYNGYLIPKGAIVVGNICAILQDEAVYGPNPEEFRPERFLLNDGMLNASMNSEPAFGYGRRQCTGKAMSRELTWMMVTSVLASIDVGAAVDAEGNKIDSRTVKYRASGSLNYPPCFMCDFRARSPAARVWIEDGSEMVDFT